MNWIYCAIFSCAAQAAATAPAPAQAASGGSSKSISITVTATILPKAPPLQKQESETTFPTADGAETLRITTVLP